MMRAIETHHVDLIFMKQFNWIFSHIIITIQEKNASSLVRASCNISQTKCLCLGTFSDSITH